MDKNDPFVTAFWQKIEQAKPISSQALKDFTPFFGNTGITGVKKWLCVCVVYFEPSSSGRMTDTEPIFWAEDAESQEIQIARKYFDCHLTALQNAERFIRQQEIRVRQTTMLSAYCLIDQDNNPNLIFSDDAIGPISFDLKRNKNQTEGWLGLTRRYGIKRIINQPMDGRGCPLANANMAFNAGAFFSQTRQDSHYYATLCSYAEKNELEPPTNNQLLRFTLIIEAQLKAGLPTNYDDIAAQIYD
jgi:hypothetical protein